MTKLWKVLLILLILGGLVAVFCVTYKMRSAEIDNELEVSKEMVEEMDNNKITKIKIVSEDKVYNSLEDYAKVAKAGDIVKCDITTAGGESKTAVDGYVVKGSHTSSKLEGNIVKIVIEGVGTDVGK